MSILNNNTDRLLELVSSYGQADSSVSSLRFELNETWMAAGYTNGMIWVYDTNSDALESEINAVNKTVWSYDPMDTKFPITNMHWMLRGGSSWHDSYWSKTLVTSTGNGVITGWDLSTKDMKKSQLFTIDETKFGGTYAMAM